ncbi:ABC transporter permease [uncultured Anaerococcus sp.]|uniref:ABC transporter permease n=1 Tax=uncultured Anaerococcus sp. TaxID=293428 RepID=UPI00288C5DA7|nr:ABC transporter permease [uncultured Anaerococcus sp.]
MFWHSFKNTFKFLLREKAMVFWALVFPIILGMFFKLAFGGISNNNKFDPIEISVSTSAFEDQNFKNFLETMEDEDYFRITRAKDEGILDTNPDVRAYIEDKDKIITKKSGIQETIVETILNDYVQKSEMINRAMEKNPQTDISKLINIENHIKDESRKNMDPINAFFYTLVGMTTIYGYMWGLYVIYQYEANLSVNAKRNAVAPIKKSVSLLASVLVSWLINFAITLVFIFYLDKTLGVDFGRRMPLLILLSLVSSLTGVAFGIFIGVSNKKNIEFKINLGIAITMLMSFLSGMMISSMKVIVQENFPILGKINPVAVVTDAIYSLYYYDSTSRFYENLGLLMLISAVFLAGSLFFMRGKEYESL